METSTSNLATHNGELGNVANGGSIIEITKMEDSLPTQSIVQSARDAMSQSPLKRKASPDADGDSEAKRHQPTAIKTDKDDFDINALNALLNDSVAAALASFPDNSQPTHDSAPTNSKEMAVTDDKNVYTQSNELMRLQSLPILKSVSTELLTALVEVPYEERVEMMRYSDSAPGQPYSAKGQSYSLKKALFDQTKEIYCPVTEFLCSKDLGSMKPEDESILRMADLAAFTCTVFNGKDIGFFDLDGYFLRVFVPMGEVLEEDLATLWLSLKTQIFLAAVSEEEQEADKETLLDSVFIEQQGVPLLERHPEKELTLCESKFLTECSKRRELLRNQVTDAESIVALSEKFSWADFLLLFDKYLVKKYRPTPPVSRAGLPSYAYLNRENAYNKTIGDNTQMQARSNGPIISSDDLDIFGEASRAAFAALQSVGVEAPSHDGLPHTSHGLMQHYQAPGHQQNGSNGQYGQSNAYPTSQTAPTQVLYEQARQASANKSSPHARRPGLPSQRKPWTQEEENALMAGLDQVRGPHWSQILALYGPKGQISEILKGRNQVQLKDKARNLKLFFLKSNIEVPYYLQCVTGELKTRAPSLAQRKEAEERARMGEGQNGQYTQYQNGPMYPTQQHHQSPYQQSSYSQQPAMTQPQSNEGNNNGPPLAQTQTNESNDSGNGGAEILDVGHAVDMKTEASVPTVPHAPLSAQAHAMQQAVQAMSSEEQSFATKLRAEVDKQDGAVKQPATF